jgi:hypothetical protein
MFTILLKEYPSPENARQPDIWMTFTTERDNGTKKNSSDKLK